MRRCTGRLSATTCCCSRSARTARTARPSSPRWWTSSGPPGRAAGGRSHRGSAFGVRALVDRFRAAPPAGRTAARRRDHGCPSPGRRVMALAHYRMAAGSPRSARGRLPPAGQRAEPGDPVRRPAPRHKLPWRYWAFPGVIWAFPGSIRAFPGVIWAFPGVIRAFPGAQTLGRLGGAS